MNRPPTPGTPGGLVALRRGEPRGLDLTSLALAAIMIGAAVLGRRVRPTV